MANIILEQNTGVDQTNMDGGAFNNFTAGNQNGALYGVLGECGVYAAASNVLGVTTGVLLIHGIRVKITEDIMFTLSSTPSSPVRYQLIAEVQVQQDTKQVTFNMYYRLPATLTQNDLYIDGGGTFQIEIAQFTHAANGITDIDRTVQTIIGPKGITFVPSVSPEGVLTWQNDGDIENPEPVNIRGAKGEPGDKGDPGASGVTDVTTGTSFDNGEYTITPLTFNFESGNSKTVSVKAKGGEKGDKGDPGVNWRYTWSRPGLNNPYNINDVVKDPNDNNIYICILQSNWTVDEPPSPKDDSTHWDLMLPKGEKGEPGDKGDPGASGKNGTTPEIGSNGNWFIGDEDTGKPSRGEQGAAAIMYIGPEQTLTETELNDILSGTPRKLFTIPMSDYSQYFTGDKSYFEDMSHTAGILLPVVYEPDQPRIRRSFVCLATVSRDDFYRCQVYVDGRAIETTGVKGDKGDTGDGLKITYTFDTYDKLKNQSALPYSVACVKNTGAVYQYTKYEGDLMNEWKYVFSMRSQGVGIAKYYPSVEEMRSDFQNPDVLVGSTVAIETTLEMYYKNDTEFEYVGKIKGEKGDPGAPGAKGDPGEPGLTEEERTALRFLAQNLQIVNGKVRFSVEIEVPSFNIVTEE